MFINFFTLPFPFVPSLLYINFTLLPSFIPHLLHSFLLPSLLHRPFCPLFISAILPFPFFLPFCILIFPFYPPSSLIYSRLCSYHFFFAFLSVHHQLLSFFFPSFRSLLLPLYLSSLTHSLPSFFLPSLLRLSPCL